MRGRTRRAAAFGAVAFVLAGWAALALPGAASADTIPAQCGQTVTAHPGDTIATPFGLKTVTDGLGSLVGGLLGGLCRITVTVVDTVVAPVPVVGAPLAGAVDNGVQGTTNGLANALPNPRQSPAPGQQPAGSPGNPQAPVGPGGSPAAPQGGTPAGATPIPDSNSPVLTGGFTSSPNYSGLPFTFSTGYSPMRDYSNIPMANAGLYAPSPGLRYGSQIPGYAPEFGILGQQGKPAAASGIENAGQAEALPGTAGGMTDGAGLPVLIAVLLLSGVSAGLVRTWVLRRMSAAT